MSRYYRLDLYFSLFVFVVGITLNVILIPPYGIEGAAFATGLSILLANLLRSLFLWVKFQLNPLSWRMLLVCIVSSIAITFALLTPHPISVYLTYLVQGLVFSIVFGVLLWWFDAIPDSKKLMAVVASRLQR